MIETTCLITIYNKGVTEESVLNEELKLAIIHSKIAGFVRVSFAGQSVTVSLYDLDSAVKSMIRNI